MICNSAQQHICSGNTHAVCEGANLSEHMRNLDTMNECSDRYALGTMEYALALCYPPDERVGASGQTGGTNGSST
jgi:hypothetical protein